MNDCDKHGQEDFSDVLSAERYDGATDRVDMDRLGKKQELQRNFRLLNIFSFMCIAMSTWVFVVSASTTGLTNGGTGGYIAVYIASCFVYFSIVISLAEMASIAPTAGGQYHWASEFAHPTAQQFISYLAGWLLTLSWLCGVASGMFLTGQMAQYAIVIKDPNFAAHPWQCWLLVVAFTAGGVFLNTVGAKHLASLQVVVAALFVLGYVSNVIVFWVMSPHNTATQVFGSFENGGGWSNFGFGILTSQTAALYLLIGSDGAAHMAEETQNASLNVPRGIISSYCIGAASGLLMLITFCFAYTDQALTSDVYSATGFAFMAVYETTTASVGGAQALTAVIIVLTFFSATNFMASASRQMYAFARDGGVPFSKFVCKVHDRLNVPVVAIIITFIFVSLVSLIDLGSSVAFNAIASLQLVALFATYEVAIGTLIYRRLYGPPLPERRWSLGRYGLAVNCFAFVYGLFALAFVVLPGSPGFATDTFNWAPVMFVGVMGLALVYFFAGGRKTYAGPVTIVKNESDWSR
ncbi:amino acid permease [Mycena leptocephala]|nr:amino acid permease [Mycena leptocephala]